MNIRQLHVQKLAQLRKDHREHVADHTEHEDQVECQVCENLNSLIDEREEAIAKIDKGVRQFRIAPQ